MKFKILLFTLLLSTITASLFASSVIDSIGVKNNDGKKMVVFKVKAKDTYYSIGRRYNIKPEVLKKFNGAKKDVLSIGAIIYVPTDIPFKKSKKEKEAEAEQASAKETKKEKKERLAREAKEAREQEQPEPKEREEAPAPKQQQEVIRVKQPVAQQPQQAAPAQSSQADTTPATQYKVSQGETLYSIAKRFGVSVDDVTKANNLNSTSLSPGRILTIPQPPAAPKPSPVISDEQQAMKDGSNVAAVIKDSSNGRHLDANKFGLYEKNEKGVATWIDDPSLDPHKMLVLHRTAPVGTIIKITNPLTNRTTFAKVVGTFSDSESTRDCIIVMTKNVADSLGAIDKRFHVNLSYGSPNE